MCQCFLNQFKWLYRSFTNKENGYSRNQYSKHSTANPKIDQQKEQRIQQIGKSTILWEFSKNKPNTSPLTQFKQPANHVQPIHIGHRPPLHPRHSPARRSRVAPVRKSTPIFLLGWNFTTWMVWLPKFVGFFGFVNPTKNVCFSQATCFLGGLRLTVRTRKKKRYPKVGF